MKSRRRANKRHEDSDKADKASVQARRTSSRGAIRRLKVSNFETSRLDGLEVITWTKGGKVASVARVYRGKYPVTLQYAKLKRNPRKRVFAKVGAYRYRLELFEYRDNDECFFIGDGFRHLSIRYRDLPDLIGALISILQVKENEVRRRS